MATTHTPLLRATVWADAPPVSLNMIATPITRHSFPTWISRLDHDASGNGPIPAMCLEGKRERPRCRHLVLRLTRRVRQELASRPSLRRKCAPPAPRDEAPEREDGHHKRLGNVAGRCGKVAALSGGNGPDISNRNLGRTMRDGVEAAREPVFRISGGLKLGPRLGKQQARWASYEQLDAGYNRRK
jgi:hypothetical protein